MGCFSYIIPLHTFVTLFESCIQFFFRFSSSTSVTYTWVVSLCICIVYVRYTFQRIPDIFFFNIQILYISVTSYVFALYTFVTLFESCIQFFFRFSSSTSVTYTWVVSLYICIVYVCYTFWELYLILFLDSARLHPLHILGWFSYVFACICTWVVFLCIRSLHFFQGSANLLFHTQILSTSVTCLWMISLLISIVYICYTFFRKLCWVFLAHLDFGYMCYTLVYSHCRQRTVEIICPHSSTPLQCNEMRPVGNLLSFCTLSTIVVIPKNQPLPKHLRKKTSKSAKHTCHYATKKRHVKITMYLGLDIIIKIKFTTIVIDVQY